MTGFFLQKQGKEREMERKSQTIAWLNWAIAVSFCGVIFAFQTGYGITNKYIAESIDLTLTDIGLVGAVYTWCFAIIQLLSGSLLDRLGGRIILPIACVFLTIGIFLTANASSLQHLIFAQFLLAVGASCGFIGAGFMGGQWFSPAKFAILFAWVQFIASSIAFFSQFILSIVLQNFHWTKIINFFGILAIIVFVLMILFLRNPPLEETEIEEVEKPKFNLFSFLGEIFTNILTTLRTKSMILNMIVGSASLAMILCLGIVWGPKLLEAKGFSTASAGFATSLSWLGLAFGAPLFAWLSGKMNSRKKPLIFSLLAQAFFICLMLFLNIDDLLTFQIIFFLFGLSVGGSMLPFTIGAELTSIKYSGTSASLVNASQFIVGGIFMSLPGKFLDSGWASNIVEALYIAPITLVIAAILAFFLIETAHLSKEST